VPLGACTVSFQAISLAVGKTAGTVRYGSIGNSVGMKLVSKGGSPFCAIQSALYCSALNGIRLTSWNWVRCKCIGCVSGVRLIMYQSSVDPTCGVSVSVPSYFCPFRVTINGPLSPMTSTRGKSLWFPAGLGNGVLRVGLRVFGNHVGLRPAPALDVTVNCMIWPVVCGSGMSPPGYGAGASLVIMTFVPAARLEKSTSTSALSPGEMSSDVRVTGDLM